MTAAGMSLRMNYLDRHGEEQTAVLHSTSAGACMRADPDAARLTLNGMFTALGMTLISATLVMEGAMSLELEDLGLPERRRPQLRIV